MLASLEFVKTTAAGIKKSFDGISKRLSSTEAAIPAPDWDESDPESKNYVRNRPFYTGDLVETELFDVCALVDAGGYQWFDSDGYKGVGIIADQLIVIDTPLVVGDRYVIKYNGETYESIAVDGEEVLAVPDSICIGDIDGLRSGNFTYGVIILTAPYVLIDDSDTSGKYFIYLVADYNGVVPSELKVIAEEQEIVMIDEKYIPDKFKKNFLLSINSVEADENGNLNIAPDDIGASKIIYVTETGGASDLTSTEVIDYLSKGYIVILKSETYNNDLFYLANHPKTSSYSLKFCHTINNPDIDEIIVMTATLFGSSIKFKTYNSQKFDWIINSSIEGSTKKFKITVDDSGAISTKEITS